MENDQEDMDVEESGQASSDVDLDEGGEASLNPEKNFIHTNDRLRFHSETPSSESDKEEEQMVENDTKSNGVKIVSMNGDASPIQQQRSRSRSVEKKRRSPPRPNIRERSEEYAFNDEKNSKPSTSVPAKNPREEEHWRSRRSDRERIGSRGIRKIWGHSPSHNDLEEVFNLHEEAERKAALDPNVFTDKSKKRDSRSSSKKRKRERSSERHRRSESSEGSVSSRSESPKHKKKKKKHKKEEKKKKEKHKKEKKRKKHHSKSENKESGEEEWVELTKELREKEAKKTRDEEAMIIGPQIPEHLLQRSNSPTYDGKLAAEERKNMLRGEAAAMAAYAAQGKRIPRRGEIGLSSSEISEFEKVGYVMSGTRHKSMEATRLRKENQILTAEEKRLLNTFTQEQRKEKEETVFKQFQELISSKKSKS
ncbi:ras-induced vulval development antagonist domain-containing protein [Ditylenchus destructor]|nr:ras-induced vulval development antagonist domain-containing protein [Ditylenchus destructor]